MLTKHCIVLSSSLAMRLGTYDGPGQRTVEESELIPRAKMVKSLYASSNPYCPWEQPWKLYKKMEIKRWENLVV